MPKTEWSNSEPLSFTATVLNASGQPLESQNIQLSISDSSGRTRGYTMERSGVGYRLSVGSLAAGSYRYSARTSINGTLVFDAGIFVVQNQPLELLVTGADYPLLKALSTRYKGSLRPWQRSSELASALLQGETLSARIQSRTETLPLIDWRFLFFVVLVVGTTEWLLRRYWSAS
jgi:hypothetical protein